MQLVKLFKVSGNSRLNLYRLPASVAPGTVNGPAAPVDRGVPAAPYRTVAAAVAAAWIRAAGRTAAAYRRTGSFGSFAGRTSGFLGFFRFFGSDFGGWSVVSRDCRLIGDGGCGFLSLSKRQTCCYCECQDCCQENLFHRKLLNPLKMGQLYRINFLYSLDGLGK